MLKNIRNGLCCSKGDKDDGHEEPLRRVSVPKGNREPETTSTPANVGQEALPEKPTRRDLWKDAFDSLPEKRQKYLSVEEGRSTTSAIDQVIQDTTEKYKEWKKSGLKIRTKRGKEFDVRGCAENILNRAMQAKDLISTAVSYDPTGKASTAWMVISMGLSMVQNDIACRDAIFAASEFLTDTLAYYTLIDTHHRDKNVGSDRNLDKSLVGVYTALLDFSAEVNKVQEQNPLVRVAASVRAITDQPLEQLKTTIKEKSEGADKWADMSSTLYNRELAESTLAQIDQSIEIARNIESKTFSAEEERILQWISTADYSKIQKETQESRAANTGNWLLALEQYVTWKASPGNILWLHGIVGCGKSVLCSTVIHDIERLCEEDASKSFGYWYFQFSNDETRSVENLIRSLIRQFSRTPLTQSVTKTWEEHNRRGSFPDRKTLSNILDNVLSSCPGEVFLILDALDECPGQPSRNERAMLLALLEDLIERHEDKLHILATSRPEQDIRSRMGMGRFSTVDLEARLAEDVEIFVRAEVNEGILCGFGQQIKARVIDELLRTEERRFRWADLQIKRLAECLTDDQIDEALQTIPETLEATYREVLDKIDEKNRGLARTILVFLCLSAVPLNTETVATAVSLRAPDLVVKICTTSLVTLSADDMVRLAHFSVKEYLVIQEGVSDHWCRFPAIQGHGELATRTVDLLLAQKDILAQETAMRQPLLVYAARNWHTHVVAIHVEPDLQEKIDGLFSDPDIYLNWLRIADGEDLSFANPWHMLLKECEPPIHRASKMGLTNTVRTLLAQGAGPLEPDLHNFSNPLIVAAKHGQLDIVELLLSKTDNIPRDSVERVVNVIDHHKDGRAKLETILSILWDRGLLFDQSEGSSKAIDQGVVGEAIANQPSGLELIGLLLDRRDQASFPITNRTLELAVYNSACPEDMMQLLFEKFNDDIHITPSFFADMYRPDWGYQAGGIDVILRERAAELPVDEDSIARWARDGNWKSMDLMLRTRPDIRVTHQILKAAAMNPFSVDMIRFLFDRRAPGTEIDSEILLTAASQLKGKGKGILAFLLDQLDPMSPITDQMILAVFASGYMRGWMSSEIFKMFLERLNPNTPLAEGLLENIVARRLDLVKLVLDRQQAGFVVSEQVVSSAASNRDHPLEILQLLMNNCSELFITERILCAAASNHKHGPSVIEYFLQLEPHSLPVTENVLIAAAGGHSEVLELILRKFPGATVTDEVYVAACKNSDSMLVLLSQPHSNPPVQKILAEIAGDSWDTAEITKILLDRQLLEVSASVVETLARSDSALEVILVYKPDVLITEKALVRAAEKPGPLRLLLHTENNYHLVTEEVMIAAASSGMSDDNLNIIFHRIPSAPVTGKVIKAAITNRRIPGLRLLLERQRDLSLKGIWEDMWKDAAIPVEDKYMATWLTHGMAGLEISDSDVQNYPYNSKNDDYGFGHMISFCCDRKIQLSVTQAAGVLILERCDNEVVEKFLGYKSDIPITDQLVQAAERNPRADKKQLLALLAEKRG